MCCFETMGDGDTVPERRQDRQSRPFFHQALNYRNLPPPLERETWLGRLPETEAFL